MRRAVAVVKDANAAAKAPEGDAYAAALINFRFLANAIWSTDEAVGIMGHRFAEDSCVAVRYRCLRSWKVISTGESSA